MDLQSDRATACCARGLRDGIPVCLGYIVVSFSFGIAASGAGMPAFFTTLTSALNFTSAGQFAALSVIAAAAPLLEMALMQLVINLRYCLMSFALSQRIAPETSFLKRAVMAGGVTDEIFGLSVLVPGRLNPWYTFGIMMVAHPGWVGGTLLGALMGGILPGRLLSALNIALYGMFIAIILPPARGDRRILGTVAASMAAGALFYYTPVLREISPGFRIILLTLAIAGIAAWLFPVREGAGGKPGGIGSGDLPRQQAAKEGKEGRT
ncbi:MAG: AzlC family ABC transporter permease [Clostridiales Family XIII bacterium]|jgi:4-azaleucine resistance transporter AzlC|nr:AzlC family ABC transporter permease [Clostridiales Family XIII bacterium]